MLFHVYMESSRKTKCLNLRSSVFFYPFYFCTFWIQVYYGHMIMMCARILMGVAAAEAEEEEGKVLGVDKYQPYISFSLHTNLSS